LGRTGAEGTAEAPIPSNARMYEIAGTREARLESGFAATLLQATLLHPDDWVTNGAERPASRLMPLEPNSDPTVLRAPAHLPKAVIEIPKRDADGNAIGGVRLPDMQAPLGVNAGQNPPLSFLCGVAAAYLAFPRTQADAEAAHDTHRPVLERYETHNDYASLIRTAARDLERDCFLLLDDAAIIIQSAAENPLWRRSAP
jgi:hypothetical protein